MRTLLRVSLQAGLDLLGLALFVGGFNAVPVFIAAWLGRLP